MGAVRIIPRHLLLTHKATPGSRLSPLNCWDVRTRGIIPQLCTARGGQGGELTPFTAYLKHPRSGPQCIKSFICTSFPSPPISSAPHTWQLPCHAHHELPLWCPDPFRLLSMNMNTCSGGPSHTHTHSQPRCSGTSSSLQTRSSLSHLPW